MSYKRLGEIALIAAALTLLVLSPLPAAAQEAGTIRGRVTEATTARPLPGAQVFIPGSGRGTLTNSAGEYLLVNVPAGQRMVRATLIGYTPSEQTVSVAAGQTATANLELAESAVALDEVVVVGYGTSRRAEVSTAVASVDAEEIANTPTASIDAALQGKAPGVQIVQNAGNPGNGITVRVRGASSLSASNQPLFVVDGVPLQTGNFSQLSLGGQDLTGVTGLNPDEIESIDILKDAAAASIYGSRGSNGVVLITTKRGRADQPRVTISAYTGQQKVENKIDLLGARDYMIFRNEARINDGRTPLFTEAEIASAQDTDWQDEVFRTAPVTDLNLALSGGTERIQYFLSGSVFDQEGVAISSAYQRQSGRLNVDFQATDKLSLRTSVGLTRDETDRFHNDNSITGVVTNAIALQPYIPARREDGTFTDLNDDLEYVNPVALGEFNTAETRSLRAVGNVEGAYAFTDQLRLTGRAGMDVLNLRDLRWLSPRVGGLYSASVNGVAQMGNTTANRYLAETFATFEPSLGASRISLTGGASVEYNDREWDFLEGEGFPSDQLRYPGSAGKITEYDAGSTGYNLVSFFSRANVTLADRYILTGSLRTDGSSRFGENNRYGVFPAASAAWIVSNEPFAGALERLGEFKLRTSYGYTGNQTLSCTTPNPSCADFASVSRYGKANYGDVAGIGQTGLENADLKWESTREFNAGADAFVFDGRVSLTVDYYNKKTNDLLVLRPIPSPSGLTSTWSNVGSIENEGWEFGLNTTNIDPRGTNGFGWTTSFNIAANRNEVTELNNDEPFTTGFINRVQVGQPLGAFYTLKFNGVDPQTGDAIFEDVNGDGQINSGDFTIVGTPHPDYFGGLGNEFSWGGLQLRTFLEFAQGFEVYNAIRNYADDGGRFADNKFADVLNRWQQPGDITDVPRASSRNRSGAATESSRWVEDGSYWRLQEVTLSYQLPRALRFGNLQDTRIFVSGRNLKTWTDYSGYSPNLNSGGSDANTFLATDFYAYPLARTITVGINATW